MQTSTLWLVSAAILLFSLSAGAQSTVDLRLNGEHNAVAPIGSTLQISTSATPFTWGNIIFSLSPGPTNVFGFTIPIGFGPSTQVIENIFHDSMGDYMTTAPLINDLVWEGVTYYAYAFTFDSTDPSGFGASNQASVTFTRHVEPGADTAGFIGQPVTLDGGGIINQGPLPSDLALSWSIVNGPAGHAAQLAGADTAFPSLSADLPGTYEVELSYSFPGTTGGATETVMVDIFDLDTTSHNQGAFDTSDPVNYAATLNGPAASSFGVVGGPAAAGSMVSGSIAAAPIATEIEFGVTAQSGQKLGHTLSIVNNTGGSLLVPPTDSLAAHLKQPVLDSLETTVEAAIAQVNPSSLLPPLPPIPVTGIPFTTATVTVQSLTFDPNIDVELTFQTGSIGTQLTINNLMMTFDITGSIFGVPFIDTGTYNATSMVVNLDLIPTVSGGMVMTTTANETAMINGATLTFTGGFLNSSAGLILGLLTPVIETTIATAVPPLVPPLIDGIFNAIPQMIDLSGQGIDITLDFVPNAINLVLGSMTISYNAGGHANASAPGAATPPAYYETPNPLPTYGANVPGTTTAYNTAGSLGDDMINQILAAATEAGALELSIDTGFVINGAMVPATAGAFDTAFPGTGFASFDPTSTVRLAVHQNLAPIVTLNNAGGMSNYALTTSNVILDVLVEAAPGHEVSALRLSASADTALTITVDLVNNTLDLIPGTTTATVRAVTSMPGVDLSGSLGTLNGLVASTLPGLLTPITGLPIPALPIGTMMPTLAGIEADGPAGDYLSIFIN